jgi:membrane fusion protein (multidrug efflux system)
MIAAGCKKDAPPGAPPPPEVAVVKVEPRRVPTTYDFTGEVQPYRRVEVRARTDGVIESREFSEGAVVKPGQVL